MPRKVVILTHTEDLTGMIPVLRDRLTARGVEVMRFDNDRFPLSAQAAFTQDGDHERIRFTIDDKTFIMEPDDAIWYRRAKWAGTLPQTMERQIRQGCVAEARAHLRGILAAAPCFVMDSPELIRWRGHKPAQQRLARSLGLATPRTVMTNDPEEARAFIASCPGGAITKMLAAFPVYNEAGEEQVVFTTALKPEHLAHLDGLRYAPMVFQEQIAKRLELRITVVGSRLFAAAIDSQSTPGAETDWRERGVTLLRSWEPYTLPPAVERALQRYMDAIGLQYSAIDMIVEPSGRHVFLEANPAGECYWLEHNSPQFPLSEALADVLLGVPGARRRFSPEAMMSPSEAA